MTIMEVALVCSLVVNVFAIVLVFITFINVYTMKLQVQQMYVGLSTTVSKIFSIEQILAKISSGFTEFIQLTENMVDSANGPMNKVLYKTTDGKYAARSIDELIEKIKKDGNNEEYFSDEELDKLKKMFESDDDLDEEDEN